jgi:hypothetical protein
MADRRWYRLGMAAVDPAGDAAPARGGAVAYSGAIHWEYSPDLDHDADPGEIVWAWVAFEDDPTIGKDRPIAVVGRSDDRRLVALMLSSRNHDGDARWIPIGSGQWDREGRPSWVRRDRVLVVASAAVRREGAVLPRSTYDAIVSAMRGTTPVAVSGPSGRVRGLRDRIRRLLGGGRS